jgi:hypothetical protein
MPHFWLLVCKGQKNISILNLTVKLLQQNLVCSRTKTTFETQPTRMAAPTSCHRPFFQHPSLRSSDYTICSILSMPLVNFSWWSCASWLLASWVREGTLLGHHLSSCRFFWRLLHHFSRQLQQNREYYVDFSGPHIMPIFFFQQIMGLCLIIALLSIDVKVKPLPATFGFPRLRTVKGSSIIYYSHIVRIFLKNSIYW